jgi:transcriptional regulator with XRE-family HTH domain
VPPADAGALGRALAKLRVARHLTQEDVARRVSTYYSEAGSYGRVERAERHPDRDRLIAILVQGLSVSDLGEINRILGLADYDGLTEQEVGQLGLSLSRSAEPEAAALVSQHRQGLSALFADPHWGLFSAGLVVGSFVLVSAMAALAPGQSLFLLVTSCLYAALYVTSVYLEGAFEPALVQPAATAALCFGFVAITSAAALAMDRILVNSGNPLALLVSLMAFLVAGVVQFFVVRSSLSEHAVVQANFQTRTAQAAHLKNTGYFLLIVVVFWLPSSHSVSTLEREVRAGHVSWVRQVVAQDLILGRGILALSVRWLLLLLFSTLLISLYMGYRLLDNLRPHPRLNAYSILFYLRALLYFALCLICVGWYAFSLSELAI